MAQNKQALKARIRSIQSTKKITKAMEMIANSKLAKQRKLMEENRIYAYELQKLVNAIVTSGSELQSKYILNHETQACFNIVFCSDLGLCGGYNSNLMKFVRANARKEDPMVVFGTHEYKHLNKEGFHIINEPISIDDVDLQEVIDEVTLALESYQRDEVSKIQIFYTKFVNTVTFEPCLNVLLPYQQGEEGVDAGIIKEIEFDPDMEGVLNQLIEQMVINVTYALSLETRTAEQASRRLAMETASDNAEELEDKLVLQFNQARQAAITQELTEIVAGADAL